MMTLAELAISVRGSTRAALRVDRTISAAAIASLLLLPVPAAHSKAAVGPSGENRVALVVGNGRYASAPLANPTNDAADIAARLRLLGFDVVERENLTILQIGATLREFRSKLSPGAVAVVFYAGHGLQIKGENYLIATDAEIAGEEDVVNQSLSVRQIFDVLDSAKTRLNLVFLDACRNNPFTRSFRSVADGLAKVDAPSGTIISYATRPGSVALDGKGHNGLYTQYLLSGMERSADPVELVLKDIVKGVKLASRGQQEPWMEGSIEGDFCFGTCGGSPVAAAAAANPHAIEMMYWGSIKDSRDAIDYRSYLKTYPDGQFADIARNRIEELSRAPATLAPATPKDTGSPQKGPAESATANSSPPQQPLGAMITVFMSEREVSVPFKVIGPVSYSSIGKFHRLSIEDAIPHLQTSAREAGANAVIIDESHSIISGIYSRGISATGRAVLIGK